ncbi:MAG: HAMP domain-containing histidine kinase [Gammaproteobacteria bacterium]|nr:HAMP domain-containing histidine kinase [Gammaproteobacteria bacterium]
MARQCAARASAAAPAPERTAGAAGVHAPEGPSGNGTLIFAEDFSQIAQQAQQLKLASLGRLTASIAHEIRNLLGLISHAAQLLRESPALPREDSRLVEIVIGNARRTNDVIESVLTLSRGQQPRPELIALGDWLRDFAAELGARDGGQLVSVELAPGTEQLNVRADPVHLRQVLTNLCENGLRYSLRAHRHGVAAPGGPQRHHHRPHATRRSTRTVVYRRRTSRGYSNRSSPLSTAARASGCTWHAISARPTSPAGIPARTRHRSCCLNFPHPERRGATVVSDSANKAPHRERSNEQSRQS